MGNTFGRRFRVTTFGESHGPAVGCVVDGCPAFLTLDEEVIQVELDRRRPGQSNLVTQRQEHDKVEILSGCFEGLTLGTPLAMMVRNSDTRSKDYEEWEHKFRPSHADLTYHLKYGRRAWPGGGRASARETVGRVAAGAVAQRLLALAFGVEIVAWVESVGSLGANVNEINITRADVDRTIVRCPDLGHAEEMIKLIEGVRKEGDTIGGTVRCVARGLPPGWGEPVFDKLEADLAKAMLSLPASKGFEVGSGFGGTSMQGSSHNDPLRSDGQGGFVNVTNHSGGIQGGISNGAHLSICVGFKPVATIMSEQDTVDIEFRDTTIKGRGRHDPCVLPRAVPIVESMVAIVLADHALRHAGLEAVTNRLRGG